ncbi:MAG: hypothetical protein MI862_09210 [Desulfobacterales bacterium]|nr:hypothetical protein [Desulfobacterales bacterium]
MKFLVGGTISIVLGCIGFAIFYSDFLVLVKGGIPLVLISGGVLIIMLKREENTIDLTDSENMSVQTTGPASTQPIGAETPVPDLEPVDTDGGTEPVENDGEGVEANKGAEQAVSDKNIEEAVEKAVSEESNETAEPVVSEVETTEPVSGTLPAEDEKEPEPVSSFAGNESSYVFHKMACKYALSKKCTRKFNTREQAIEAGFKPCNICKP